MNRILIALLLVSVALTAKSTPFEKVIVLVMENHSYDNILGYMDAPIGTLNEEPFCNETKGKQYCTSKGADFRTIPDPGHGYSSVNEQLFMKSEVPGDTTEIPSMGGFAQNYKGMSGEPQNVFDCYTKEQLPIISTLAEEFMVFDNWFCSVPTQTDPNKFFVNAASAGGNTGNCGDWYCYGYPVELETIFEQLQDEDHSWEIHWMDWCEAMAFSPLNKQKDLFVEDQNFQLLYQQFEEGTLSDYTYLVPRIYEDNYIDIKTGKQVNAQPNTQHPSEDVRNGEQLIKEVYENFRKSQYWENTLLVLTYDEHGGFPDHVVPPYGVANPNPEIESQNDFNFERLGIRVPSIAISPWIKQGINHTQFEHATIPKVIREIFDLKAPYLNEREAQANSFLNDEIVLNDIRNDCPETLPEVPFGKDYLYTMKPENHLQNSEDLNGTPVNQIRVLGSMLINQGSLNPLKLQQIGESIKTDKQAMQFVKEAQALLGFRSIESVKGFKYLHEHMVLQNE